MNIHQRRRIERIAFNEAQEKIQREANISEEVVPTVKEETPKKPAKKKPAKKKDDK
tara:strand:+ start:198 stop:365 length:168 start_codon:yes stop_codon:yes gene_type:complete